MIKGKIKKIIYRNDDNAYTVALFRISNTDEEILKEKLNKTITITGVFNDLKMDITMKLEGVFKETEKFGYQYVVENFEIEKPTTKEAIIEFLSSSFIEGCGEKTAKKIVDEYGEKTLEIIKENKNNLLMIEGITAVRATKIHDSLIEYDKSSDTIINLQNLGFSMDECSKIYNRFANEIDNILGDGFYDLKELIEFKKLDNIYMNNFGNNDIRNMACIEQSMEILSNNDGDTYYFEDDIISMLQKEFMISLNSDEFNNYFDQLVESNKTLRLDKRYYLKKYYQAEDTIARNLKIIDSFDVKKIPKLEDKIKKLEKKLNITYNEDQQKAIMCALNNNITIISGGPGTGKTTIINAIVKLYIEEYRISSSQIMEEIALLAPTGRASKKMATSTNISASTIHRYLKWYKERDDFYYNEFNKTKHRLIIVDEVSMIDVNLFNALLKGISPHVKLILVGDIFQLPSVGAGLVLKDLIDSDYFNYVPLNIIYRQSNNSYIPYLAKEIKNVDLSEDFLNKRDDYSFFSVNNSQIKGMIEQIIHISRQKEIDEKSIQILAPMYKGENGIDNLNIILQKIYNPMDNKKEEIRYGEIIYRENDKVLQLVNDLDNNVFNGDIGYIKKIYNNKIVINFDGNVVEYEKKNLFQIKHAYAITIHKSQGSEFEHVIMPVCRGYYKMLYNKLIYTGVSRAKKSLTIVGEVNSFVQAIKNNYSDDRNTSLKEKIIDIYNK